MTRSDCPISSALDHLGDRWSLLIIRDIAFFGKKSYSSLLESEEGIATNILSSRLNSLEKSQIISKQADPSDGRRSIYNLTDAGKDLLPVLVEMIVWSAKHNPEDLDIPEDLVKKAKQDREELIKHLRQQVESETYS